MRRRELGYFGARKSAAEFGTHVVHPAAVMNQKGAFNHHFRSVVHGNYTTGILARETFCMRFHDIDLRRYSHIPRGGQIDEKLALQRGARISNSITLGDEHALPPYKRMRCNHC